MGCEGTDNNTGIQHTCKNECWLCCASPDLAESQSGPQLLAQDWQPRGPGGLGSNPAGGTALWQFRLPHCASVFRRRH